jgi:hypothetical protein
MQKSKQMPIKLKVDENHVKYIARYKNYSNREIQLKGAIVMKVTPSFCCR